MMFDAEYKAMLQPILDDPADDTARLIFADWLEEKCGEKEEAEFIRYGVEGRDGGPGWFKMPWAPRWERGEFIGMYAKRGFICEIHLTWESWLAEYKHWLEWYPIEKVKLTTRPAVHIGEDRRMIALGDSQPLEIMPYVSTFDLPRREDPMSELLKYYWPKIEFELPPDGHIPWEDAQRLEARFERPIWPSTQPAIPPEHLEILQNYYSKAVYPKTKHISLRGTDRITLQDAMTILENLPVLQNTLFAQMLHKEGDLGRSQADTGDDNRST